MSNEFSPKPRIAVIYQAIEPPLINGVKKPAKPGGYQDSCADIAFALSTCPGVEVTTPLQQPDPRDQSGWSYPDTEEGILAAIKAGATHIWANTSLFASHPLQTSPRIGEHQDDLRIVGQSPMLVEKYDDKEFVNDLLRRAGGLDMPRGWSFQHTPDFAQQIYEEKLPYPVVAKPVRGRGSHGVKVCAGIEEMVQHAQFLFGESPIILVEEFLAGEEATVTVMPPSPGHKDYWSLPVVTRFNHLDGIAPYNGVVAVTANSRAVQHSDDPAFAEASRQCERAARILGVISPIRIDIRRIDKAPDSKFALFDVNMKPNMTGPGRPKRDDQASLSLMAAEAVGWNYQTFLLEILKTARTLKELRRTSPRTI